MYRTIAAQPDRFCAYYEPSASSDLRSADMVKSFLKGTAAILKGLSAKRR